MPQTADATISSKVSKYNVRDSNLAIWSIDFEIPLQSVGIVSSFELMLLLHFSVKSAVKIFLLSMHVKLALPFSTIVFGLT